MNWLNKFLLINAGIGALSALIFSLLQLGKLGDAGDMNPILAPLRIINRDVYSLAIAVLLIIVYLWRKDK